jgi:hypothetical protein
VDNPPAAGVNPKPVPSKPSSSRSAAFLKLVVNVGNETNHE